MKRWQAGCLDLIAVAVFVVLGLRAHEETGTALLFVQVATPFLIGLAAGWFTALRRHWDPAAMRPGVWIWAWTWVFGMLLRGLVFRDDTPVTFIVVAGVFLGIALLGWRAVRFAIVRRTAGRRPQPSPERQPVSDRR